MADLSFAAQVSDWVLQEKERETAVFRESAQMVEAEAKKAVGNGGRMPVVTGNLRRSLMASTTSMPTVIRDKATYSDRSGEISLVIGGAEIGDTIYLGFQAAYALRMEYGYVGTDSLGRTYNQKGYGFVEATAQRWPQIVKEAEAKVMTAAGAQ
ncbi:hypothetical protein ABIA22_002254 [Sinorhizobium fredii]|uniref:hypothetical protein n=1 Tax=Rhizobium fredii TaxID=380 RepID=UPI003510E20C